jgi:long-subunit fatty acid transport protein
MNRGTTWIALLLGCGLAAASQNPGAVFLMIWPAARPTALGGAFTAIADDASTVYYNPGGMAFLERTNATLMHCNWLPGLYPGMYYEYAGLTYSL